MSPRCSEGAALRGDPALGTAPPQRDWLLVEHHGPWPVSAPFGAELPDALLRRLGHPGRRVLFVRPYGDAERPRPTELAAPPEPRRWFTATQGRLRSGTWTEPDDLLATLQPDAGSVAEQAPMLLVCTHGVHDVCCAVAGRPVAAALTERWPERTFECSHLGGDRFAANLLLLPDGGCYGGVPAERAAATVESHLAGRPDLALLRGVAGLHPAEQVAQAAALERFGPAPLTDLSARLVEQHGDFASGAWTVEVTGPAPLPPLVRVVITSSRRPLARLTCRAVRDTGAAQWDVVSVTDA